MKAIFTSKNQQYMNHIWQANCLKIKKNIAVCQKPFFKINISSRKKKKKCNIYSHQCTLKKNVQFKFHIAGLSRRTYCIPVDYQFHINSRACEKLPHLKLTKIIVHFTITNCILSLNFKNAMKWGFNVSLDVWIKR